MKLPGLIDPHVHLRDMGQSEKEDFYSGTSSAVAGGFTTVLDMPNNLQPITTLDTLTEKINTAKDKTICNLGFYFGSNGDNINEFEKVKNLCFGLKIFLNETTGNYLIDENRLEQIFTHWPKDKVILFHAEEDKIDLVINILKKHPRKIHICHISTKTELERIITAKELGLNITCGVTPHHLFLTENDLPYLLGFGKVKPFLKSSMNQDFLWKNISAIDCIESDHAPHTLIEKESNNIPYGIPGLETTLPLLITAMHDRKISLNEIIEKCYTNPAKIFQVPTTPETFIEIDPKERYEIKNENLFTKCKWTPFNGWKVYGKIKKTIINNIIVFENHNILVSPGSGKINYP